MSLALELARRINALRFENLPRDAVHWARIGILDTVGVTLAGSRDAYHFYTRFALLVRYAPAIPPIGGWTHTLSADARGRRRRSHGENA